MDFFSILMIRLKDLPPFFLIGHRGYAARFPENTTLGFCEAVKADAIMIELDVCLSSDRIPVVVHDDTLDRTTHGTGLVSESTLARIKTLDAGSWFDPKFKGLRIPTLDEVFQEVGGKCLINVEIKGSAYEEKKQPDSIETQVTSLITKHGLLDQTLISSFHPEILERISEMESSYSLAVLTNKRSFTPELAAFCYKIKAFSWNPDHSTLIKDQVQSAHNAGLKVMPYTVNDPARTQELKNMGVDALFTDDPGYSVL